ncbi:MAG: hypothetical protein JSW44_00840 [Candidatus Bathyarchaeota archaeon]|nr:MAG: hypothetical protein JSW44_00840 [Candidatus Bathyarchaeota archaeon]
MSRNSKIKLETQADVPLQVISENFTEEYTFTAADGCNSNNSLEKGKDEANTPIFIKRV